jgi:putative photosynthetic complex assembly protein
MRTTMKQPVETVPRQAVIALGAVLAATLIAVATVRLSGVEIRTPDAPTAAQRSLRFEDGPAGSVVVIDAKTGAVIEEVTGEAGFLRGSLRALVRERKKRDIGAGPAFELIARTDGRLTLADPATGERLDLESFGPTNSAVYRRWLVDTTPRP